MAAGFHPYLRHVNATDPTSPVESQLPHMAAFMLAQQENWYIGALELTIRVRVQYWLVT